MSVDVGVVIGRFQVDVLHEGHRFLINKVCEQHQRVIIFLGCAPLTGTKYDPLDYRTRFRMITAEYPEAVVLPLYDKRNDDLWSEEIDRAIKNVFPNVDNAVLYGGRDSFKEHYLGRFSAIEIESPITYRSGTEQRSDIGKAVRNSSDFRAGIIYSTQNAWPYVRSCVDIACIDKGKVLVGKKAGEAKWRLPGGLVDSGESLEKAAARELYEETGCAPGVDSLKYVGSFSSGDWRFKKAGEMGLTTALFVTQYTFGGTKAGDDLVEVSWINLNDAEKMVVRSHKPLIKALQKEIAK